MPSIVVQCCADLQSVHKFHCYDNTHVCKFVALYTANAYSAEREMSASACTVLALWLVVVVRLSYVVRMMFTYCS